AKLSQIAAVKIFKHQVMKCGAMHVERGPVAEPADDVRMSHAIECDGFVLKILDQGLFQFRVLISLKQNIQRFDYDTTEPFIGRRVVARQIDLRIAAASQTFLDVVTTVEPALEKLEFSHCA